MEKVCRKSHTRHEVMDTRHTIEVNVAKSSSFYACVTSPKMKQILERSSPTPERRIKLLDEGKIEDLLYEGMTTVFNID